MSAAAAVCPAYPLPAQLVCQRKAKDGSLEYCLLLNGRSHRDVVWKARVRSNTASAARRRPHAHPHLSTCA